MKKSFYFALALTAGLFASCSSDEIAQAPNGGLAVDDNTPVKIEIGKASAGYEITRGTGRVGDATAGNKQWKGQEFTVLMLEKGTMKGAYADLARTTPILKGTNYKTNEGDDNVLSLDPNAIYYPTVDANNQTAVFDFWGFRLDRSETPTAGTPVFNGYDVASTPGTAATYKYSDVTATASDEQKGAAIVDATIDYTAAADAADLGKIFTDGDNTSPKYYAVVVDDPGTDAAGNQITVPFKIDGTQDIMVATTSPSDATYEPAHPGLLYSAKSARAGVVPNMEFKHLLTSLTFKVKPKSSNITKKATNPTTSAQWKPGYTITNIQVKSKATGELIVAYTGDTEPAERIIWDAGEKWDDATTLATFQLQCRKKEVQDAAHIKMKAIDKTITTNLAYEAGYIDMNGQDHFTYTTTTARDAFEVYDSDDLDDETGLPTGNKTTLGAITTGTVGYILTYDQVDRTSTVAKKYLCEYKASAQGVTSDLVPFATKNVDPIVLDWQGTDEIAVVIANSAASTKAVFDAADAAKKYTYDGVNKVLTLADWQNTLAAGTDYIYCDASDADPANYTYTKFDVTTAYQAAAATAGDNAVTSGPVGEPMLVAPSNDAANSGYVVYVTYKYWKKQTASTVVETTATTNPIIVNNYTMPAGVKVPCAFEAGKNYNVTLTLYSDGEVLNGEATSEHWEEGGNLDAGEDD